MVNYITVKDSGGNNRNIHTIEDSTSVHFNQSIPTDQDGNVAAVVSGNQAATSAMGALVVAFHPNTPLPVGTNHLGKVSIAGQFDVSVGTVTANIADNAPVSVRGGRVSVLGISDVSVQDNAPVSVRGGHVSVLGISDVSVQDNAPVSVRGGNIRIMNANDGTLAIVGNAANGQAGQSSLFVHAQNKVYNTSASNWDLWDGYVSIKDNAPVSVRGGRVSVQGIADVSIQDNAPVSVRNTVNVSINAVNTGIPNADGQSLGGATQGHLNARSANMVFNRNSSTWDRLSGTSVGIPVSINPQILTVHVCNESPAVSVNGPLPAGTNHLGKVSVEGGFALSDNAPVSVHGGIINTVQAVSLGGGSAVIGKVSVDNLVAVSINGPLPAGTNHLGKVSVEGLSITGVGTQMVSVGGAVSTQVVQVGYSDGTNVRTPYANSAGVQRVSVMDDKVSVTGHVSILGGHVSVGGGRLRTVDLVSVVNAVSLGGGTALVGGVSVRQIVSVTPNHNTGAAFGTNAMPVGGSDGTNLVAIALDTAGVQKVTGFVTNSESSFTRTTDTVAYATGDLVANTTVAGNVTPLSFALSRFSGGGGAVMIRRARIVCSDPRVVDRNYRLHLFNTSNGASNQGVSVAGCDNTAFQPTKVSAYLGAFEVSIAVSGDTAAVGWGYPQYGQEISVVLPASQFSIQGLLEARTSISVSTGSRFNVTLEAFQD